MESMRQRDPILYHQYVGRLPCSGIDDGPDGPGDACTLSERIMRQHEGLEQARCLQAATLQQVRPSACPTPPPAHITPPPCHRTRRSPFRCSSRVPHGGSPVGAPHPTVHFAPLTP